MRITDKGVTRDAVGPPNRRVWTSMGFLLEEIRLTTERMYQTHCKWWDKLQNNLTLIGFGRISELEYGSEMIDPNTVQMWNIDNISAVPNMSPPIFWVIFS